MMPVVSVIDEALLVKFPHVVDVLSWAPWNGGSRRAAAIVNRQVAHHDCGSPLSREKIFGDVFARLGVGEDSVGMMTAADVAAYRECVLTSGKLWVHAVATVGLTNARSVLDEADVPLSHRCSLAGTINIIVACNALPGLDGRVEAVHMIAAAKATALFDRRVTSRKSERPAALTGTDCVVVASSGEIAEDHCGMHTVTGELICRAVHDVVTRGADLHLASSRNSHDGSS